MSMQETTEAQGTIVTNGKGKRASVSVAPVVPQGFTVQTEGSVITASLGSRGSRGDWNTVIEADLSRLAPHIVHKLLCDGLAYKLRSAGSKDSTEKEAKEAAEELLQELYEGKLSQRRTAATAIERKALEIVREHLKAKAHSLGKKIKTADLDDLAHQVYAKNRERFDVEAARQIEAAKANNLFADIDI